MPDIALPSMREITVSPDNLILDPNNPRLRLISGDDDNVPEERAVDPGIVERTRSKLIGNNDRFHLEQLKKSILSNGWQPVDQIFVKAHQTKDNYLVLEGNRRVMAIRDLLNKTLPDEHPLRDDLQEISVMEVLEDASPEELNKKISYLLGVRHHGSLQKWTPFAQANNIYLHYLQLSKQRRENFLWDQDVAEEISSALSITPKEVEHRLKVFRAMQQIGSRPEVKSTEPDGGMKDTYYSICGEGLLSRNKYVADFITQDQSTFLLDEDSCIRMEKLCHFSQPRRSGSPLNNPREWRYLGNILGDHDEQKRTDNLQKVLDKKERPSAVWAVRAEELRKLQWDKWLNNVSLLLQKVELGDDFGPKASFAIEDLTEVLMSLEALDAN